MKKTNSNIISVQLDCLLTSMRGAADTSRLDGMARFGISTEKRLGLKIPEVKKLARTAGCNQELALGLWTTRVDEARILATLIADGKRVDGSLMDNWAGDLSLRDLCHQGCIKLFRRRPEAWTKIEEWAGQLAEFLRRPAFVLIATLAVHEKESDQRFAN